MNKKREIRLCHRYSHAATKMLDGNMVGSSSLWAQRASKGYGHLPATRDTRPMEKFPPFDYGSEDLRIARRVRTNYYEQISDPRHIPAALRFCPVPMDVQIFTSIWNDSSGIVTMPDEEDAREKLDHTFSVIAHDELGLHVSSGWRDWGQKSLGYIPFSYLEKYFVTAFATITLQDMLLPQYINQKLLRRSKPRIKGKKWYQRIFAVPSLVGNSQRHHLNIEIYSPENILAGWAHVAGRPKADAEIIELFILPEFRRRRLGTHLITLTTRCFGVQSVTGWISGHDLYDGKDDVVRSFLVSNGYLPFPDRSKFRDCRWRLESMQ